MSPQDTLSIPAVRRKWQMDIGSIAMLQLGVILLSLLSVGLCPTWGGLVPLFAYWTFLRDVSVDKNAVIRQVLEYVAFFDQGVRKRFPLVWQLVEAHARAVAMPRPDVLLLLSPGASACAWTHPRPTVGLRYELASLPPNLVSAMLAHEIAHLKNKDQAMAGCILASLSSLLVSLRWFVICFGGQAIFNILFRPLEEVPSLGSVLAFVLLVAAVLAGMKLFFTVWFPKVLQQHEYAADALGSVITGDPISLIMVLTMTEETPAGRRVRMEDEDEPLELQTHPPTEDRVRALMRLTLEMQNDKTP